MTTISQNNINTPVATIFGDWREKFGELWTKQVAALKEKFSSDIEEVRMPGDFPTDVPIIYVRKEAITSILKFAKDPTGLDYGFLADITATDEGGEFRFEVVYNLKSLTHHSRLRFKARVRENEDLPTVIDVWPGANWAEREVYDMFGVKFRGHPDLRRILMDYRWVGHPLRKDYPLKGYQIFPTPEPVRPELLE